MSLVVIITKVILFDIYNEMCQNYNSIHYYFPNDQYMMLYSYIWIKYLFKKHNIAMDFIGTEYEKFIYVVSDSTLK